MRIYELMLKYDSQVKHTDESLREVVVREEAVNERNCEVEANIYTHCGVSNC